MTCLGFHESSEFSGVVLKQFLKKCNSELVYSIHLLHLVLQSTLTMATMNSRSWPSPMMLMR
uniref:Uncharacterized protein n=1 Tax=Arundo donax TaxID=35708 RepID=A0A0A8YXY6_ARUDO